MDSSVDRGEAETGCDSNFVAIHTPVIPSLPEDWIIKNEFDINAEYLENVGNWNTYSSSLTVKSEPHAPCQNRESCKTSPLVESQGKNTEDQSPMEDSQSKPYKCSVCGKCFKLSFYLRTHIRTHTGERPYECTFCGQRYTQKTTLNQHIKLHSNKRPFACPQCPATFKLATYLNMHLKNHPKIRKFAPRGPPIYPEVDDDELPNDKCAAQESYSMKKPNMSPSNKC